MIFDTAASLTIQTTNSHKLIGGALTNKGTTTWTGGEVETRTGTTINNNSGATFSTSTDNIITSKATDGTTTALGSSTFTNAGKFEKTGGSGGATEIQAQFNSSGTGSEIKATSGRLKLTGGGTSSSNVTVGSGAKLEIATTNYSFTGGNLSSVSDGAIEVTSATATFNGTSGDANLTVAGGTAAFTGAHNGSGKLTLSSGNVTSSGSGSATFNAFDWSGGTVNGKVNASSSAANVSGGNKLIDTAGDLTVAGSATATPDAWNGNVTNNGKLTHASGSTELMGNFTNGGNVTASAGILKLSGGGSSSGNGNAVNVGDGAKLQVASAYAFTGTALATTGTGAVEVATGGTATFNGTSGNANLAVNGGTATFNGTHTGSGKLSLSSGTVNGTSTATFNAFDWSGGTVNGKVSATGSAANVSGGNKLIDTAGDLTVAGSGTATPDAWNGNVTNNGKLTHASGSTELSGNFTNGGNVTASAGILKLSGGGSSSGNGNAVNVGDGAKLQVASAYVFTGTALATTGTGAVEVATGGTATFNGTSGNANLAVAGGTAAFTGAHNGSGKLSLSSGNVTSSGSGAATFGSLDWTGGDVNGKVTSNGTATASGATMKTIGTSGELTLTGSVTNTFSDGGLGSGLTNNGKLNHSATSTDIQTTFTNAGTGTVTASSGTLKLSGGGNSSGNIVLGAGAKVQVNGKDFAITGGNISSNGTTGKLELTSNTTTFTNTTSGDAEFNVAGGTAKFDGTHNGTGKLSLASGSVTGSGHASFSSLDWQGGDLNGKVTSNGNSTASSASAKTIGSAGELTLAGASTNTWTGGAVTNQGKLNQNAGNTDIQASFNNSGNVNANAGTLKLAGGGSSSGTGNAVNIGDGAKLQVASAYAFTGTVLAANGTGATGAVDVTTGGTATFDGTSGSANLNVAGGTASFTGTHNGSGKLSLSSGNVTGSGSGAATFGALDWSGGDVNGKVTATGTTNISNNANGKNISGELTLGGTTNWDGSQINTNGTAKITNQSGVTFRANSDGLIAATGSASFVNAGTFEKTAGGANGTEIHAQFNNTGGIVVGASAGTLKLTGGGSSTTASGSANSVNVGTGGKLQIDTGNFTFDSTSFSGGGTVELKGANTTFKGASGSAKLSLAGGNADFNGAATTAASLALSSTTSSLTTGNSGSLNVGTLDWTAGNLNGKVSASGATTLSGNDAKTIGATGDLNVAGSTSGTATAWTGGAITNQGKLTHNSGSTDVSAAFNNSGNVNANGGALKLSGGGSSSGTIALGSGAEVQIATTDFAITGGSINGSNGKLKLTGATTTFSGTTSGDAEFNVAGGTAAFTGTHQGSGKLSLSSGTVTSSGAGNATFSSLDWQGGNVNGKLTSNGSANLSGGAKALAGGELTFNGDTVWDGSQINASGAAKLTNNTGKKFSANADGLIANSGTAAFKNDGTFEKTAGNTNGATEVQAKFDNSGAVNVNAGKLKLSGGGSSSGTISVTGTGSEVEISNGFSLASGAKVNGKVRVTGGILNALGNLDVNGLSLEGGSITGSQTFLGALAWLAGDFSSSSLDITTLAGGSTFTIGSASDHNFNGRSFVNHGTVNWTGGKLGAGNNASFLNASDGIFNDNASSDVNNGSGGAATFTNNGSYNKNAAGTTTIYIPFVNDNGSLFVSAGTLRFNNSFTQKSGTLNLSNVTNGSVLQFDQGLTIAASGILKGTGTVVGNVTSSGTIAPGNSPGLINVSGNLTLKSASVLLLELGGTTQGTTYDFLSISGNADLGGAVLNLSFTNNFQNTVTGLNTFTVLTASSLSGAFSNVTSGTRLFTMDGLGSFRVNYGTGSAFAANSVVLDQFVAVPEPSTYALLAVGLGIVAVAIRRRARR